MDPVTRVSRALQDFRRRRVTQTARPIAVPEVGDLDGWRRAVSDQTDALGLGIDAPIQELVALLNAHGIETRGSCAGHPHGERGNRTALPYIDVLRREDLVRLEALLEEMARDGVEIDGLTAVVPDPESPTELFRLQSAIEWAAEGDVAVDDTGARVMSVWQMWIWGDDHVRAADLTDAQRAALRERAAALEQLAASSLPDLRAQMDALTARLEHDLAQGHLLSERPRAPVHARGADLAL